MPATIFTYSIGVISSLVFGAEMCLTMVQIGSGTDFSFADGIILGIAGLLGMGIDYPIYKRILKKGKQKYAFEIMELAKDITGDRA